jgi:hypothetical protein
MEQGHPGSGRPFDAGSVLFLANFLARALASERRLYAFLLTGLEVKGVALHFFNNVFLLYFALEAACSRISAKQTHPQTRPDGPNSYYKDLTVSQVGRVKKMQGIAVSEWY